MIILKETLKRKLKKTESNNCSIIHCFGKNNYKHTKYVLWLFAKMPLARCLAESLYGVFPGLLGQFKFGDVSVANGRETPA